MNHETKRCPACDSPDEPRQYCPQPGYQAEEVGECADPWHDLAVQQQPKRKPKPDTGLCSTHTGGPHTMEPTCKDWRAEQLCERCGKVAPIRIRAVSGPALCPDCYQKPAPQNDSAPVIDKPAEARLAQSFDWTQAAGKLISRAEKADARIVELEQENTELQKRIAAADAYFPEAALRAINAEQARDRLEKAASKYKALNEAHVKLWIADKERLEQERDRLKKALTRITQATAWRTCQEIAKEALGAESPQKLLAASDIHKLITDSAIAHLPLDCGSRYCAQHRDIWRHYEDWIAHAESQPASKEAER
jgi:hypothetical protein